MDMDTRSSTVGVEAQIPDLHLREEWFDRRKRGERNVWKNCLHSLVITFCCRLMWRTPSGGKQSDLFQAEFLLSGFSRSLCLRFSVSVFPFSAPESIQVSMSVVAVSRATYGLPILTHNTQTCHSSLGSYFTEHLCMHSNHKSLCQNLLILLSCPLFSSSTRISRSRHHLFDDMKHSNAWTSNAFAGNLLNNK